MKMKRPAVLLAVMVASVVWGIVTLPASAAPCAGFTFGAPFVGSYTCNDLGSPTDVPSPLGGITFLDNSTLLIGGSANNPGGVIDKIGVTRGSGNHITGFSGSATLFSTAFDIDGGLSFGPGGVLFFTEYPVNALGEIKSGSASPDKTIDLNSLSVDSSVGALAFVPAGFAGAGKFKLVVYNTPSWYEGTLTPDGSGTFDLSVVKKTTLNGGTDPEGMVYVHGSNPGFGVDSILLSRYASGKIVAIDIDGNGDPIPATERDFLTGLSGAEGAVIDPLTGDFLFSTFGGGNRVVVISGFEAPPSDGVSVPEPGTLWLLAAGLATLLVQQRRRAPSVRLI